MSGFILLPQKKYEEFVSKIDQLLELERAAVIKNSRIEDWISEQEAQKLLGLKETSLWALRKRKQLGYSKIGSKTFYSLKSMEKLLNKNQE